MIRSRPPGDPMDEEKSTWFSGIDLESVKKLINLKSLPHMSDEDRFKTVMNSIKSHRCFKTWKSRLQVPRAGKNAKDSRLFREEVNLLYKIAPDVCMNIILEGLTRTLAHAPQGSPEMALAYANRSAILLKVRLYKDALQDITRALKSGYPDRLKAKLFARRALCLKALGTQDSGDVDRALENARKWLRRMEKRHPHRRLVEDTLRDFQRPPPLLEKWNSEVFLKDVFQESPEIVGASSSIHFSGDVVRASRDIIPGEIIAVQEPFVAALHERKSYCYCAHCFIQTFSGIPCTTCVLRIYCSETCKDTAWREYHDLECGVVEGMEFVQNDVLGPMIVRAIIRALKEAGSLQALRGRVRSMENNSELLKRGFSGSVFDGRSLETFFSLPTHAAVRKPRLLLAMTMTSVFMTFVLATKGKFFGEQMTTQRFFQNDLVPFVGGLMTRFTLIMVGGSQEISSCLNFTNYVQCGLALAPLYARLSHSCAPNVSVQEFRRKSVMFARYPIKKGERLIGCRASGFELAPTDERQKALKTIIGIQCKCIACKENWTDDKSSFDVTQIPPHLWALYNTVDRASVELFELASHGVYPAISKLLDDLAKTMTEFWKFRQPPCPIISNLTAFICKFYALLGNRHQILHPKN
uniref:SMYD4_1 protein n=2 Tax=Fopius arisanus TaxID=64838 RepID=A0A0C9QWF2_9HYME